MDKVIEQFTLVDFLSLFAPGAIFVFAINEYWFDLTGPVSKLFDGSIVILTAYFIMLSYLFGHVVEELGDKLEHLLWKCPFWEEQIIQRKYFDSEEIKDAYNRCFPGFHASADIRGGDKARNVFHYVQRKSRPQRIIIFSAFYMMSRSMVVMMLLFIVFILRPNWALFNHPFAVLLGCLFLTLVLCLRWIRFEKKCVDEAFLIFISDFTEKNSNRKIGD